MLFAEEVSASFLVEGLSSSLGFLGLGLGFLLASAAFKGTSLVISSVILFVSSGVFLVLTASVFPSKTGVAAATTALGSVA